MEFRARLLSTLRAIQPVLDVPGVLVVGSEVPNLLERGAASTLVISQDVDVAVPVRSHADVKVRLRQVTDLARSPEEPSVWLPRRPELIEVNFVGTDEDVHTADDTYVLQDTELPLLVFGPLSFIRAGRVLVVDDVRVPLPRIGGLLAEKLVTDRTAEKGDRDLLVVAGLLSECSAGDLDEAVALLQQAPPELRYAACSALTVLSLMQAVPGMPDPVPHRAAVRDLLVRLEEPR